MNRARALDGYRATVFLVREFIQPVETVVGKQI
jgi:hypothetical protein